MEKVKDFIFENWVYIAPLLYEIIVRLKPTEKNLSIIDLIFKFISTIIPNRQKNVIKSIILFCLISVSSFAQDNVNVKSVRLSNAFNGGKTLSNYQINGTIIYDPSLLKFRGYQNGVWVDLGGGAGGDMVLASVQTSTGTKTFKPSATLEGINVGSVAANPSAPNNGGVWYNSTQNFIIGRISATNARLLSIPLGTTVANQIPYFTDANGTFTTNSSLTFTTTNGFSTSKGTFAAIPTNANIALSGIASDPTVLNNGDIWHNSTSGILKTRINGVTNTIATSNLAVAGEVPAMTGNGTLVSSDFRSSASTKILGLTTNAATAQIIQTDGSSANVALSIQAKGTSNVSLVAGSGTANLVSSAISIGVNATSGLSITANGGAKFSQTANIVNGYFGTVTLAAGTATVNTNVVTNSSIIILTTQTLGGTLGFQYISAKVAGTSFTITSTSGTDTSTVAYWVIN